MYIYDVYIHCMVCITISYPGGWYGKESICNAEEVKPLSRVWLFATPWTVTYQAPWSMGFSRQDYWSGLPFPSPMHESGKWKWSRSAMSDSSWPHGLQPTRLLRPWDFPGKTTGVGCHCLLPGWLGKVYFCSVVLGSFKPSQFLPTSLSLIYIVRHGRYC